MTFLVFIHACDLIVVIEGPIVVLSGETFIVYHPMIMYTNLLQK
jgi:hypothetical protein